MSKKKLGSVFTSTEDPSSRLGEVFQAMGRDPFPQVVVIDDLDAFRTAVEEGTLDLSEVERRYGPGAYESTPFLPLPALADGSDLKRAFRMEGSRLIPPR